MVAPMYDSEMEDLGAWALRREEQSTRDLAEASASVVPAANLRSEADPPPAIDPIVSLGDFARLLREHIEELALLAAEVGPLPDDLVLPVELLGPVRASLVAVGDELVAGIREYLGPRDLEEIELISTTLAEGAKVEDVKALSVWLYWAGKVE